MSSKTQNLDYVITGTDKSGSKAFQDLANSAQTQLTKIGGYFKEFLGAAAITEAVDKVLSVADAFETVDNTIRAKTGASGEALKQLSDTAKTVATQIPASFQDAATTVADITSRLGLTGSQLQTVAEQVLNINRMMGDSVDASQVSGVLNAYGVSAKQASLALDQVFTVAQRTGTQVSTLFQDLQAGAPALQQLGFGFTQSAALMGELNRVGLSSQSVLMGMRKGLVDLAKTSGSDIPTAFKSAIDSIQSYLKAGDEAAALRVADKIFGARGAATFVQAVQSGVLSFSALEKAADSAGGAVNKAGQQTLTIKDQLTLLGNQLQVAMGPGIEALIKALGPALKSLQPAFTQVGTAIGGVVQAITPLLPPIAELIDQLVGPLMSILPPVEQLFAQLMPVFNAVALVIADILVPAVLMIANVLKGVVDFVSGVFTGNWSKAWLGIQEINAAVWSGIIEIVQGGINGIIDLVNGFDTMLNQSGMSKGWIAVWYGFEQVIADVWGGIVMGVQDGVNGVIVVLNGLISAYNAVASFFHAGTVGPIGSVNFSGLMWNPSAPTSDQIGMIGHVDFSGAEVTVGSVKPSGSSSSKVPTANTSLPSLGSITGSIGSSDVTGGAGVGGSSGKSSKTKTTPPGSVASVGYSSLATEATTPGAPVIVSITQKQTPQIIINANAPTPSLTHQFAQDIAAALTNAAKSGQINSPQLLRALGAA